MRRGAILCDFEGCWNALVVSSPEERLAPPVNDIIQHRAWVQGWTTDDQDRDTTFSLVWIHPDFNDQFCHYYDSKPGDLANFYVVKETTDLGDDWLDVATLDDLLVWSRSNGKIGH